MSLRIAPHSNHSTSTSNTISSSTSKGAPSAPGIHDTLRSSLTPASSSTTTASSPTPESPTSTHPLEARLAAWQSTQETLKMNLLRRNYGIAEPVRRGMEARICKEGEWRPACLGGSANVAGDVLAGRDAEVTWDDVYRGDETREGAGVHAEMESKVGMERW